MGTTASTRIETKRILLPRASGRKTVSMMSSPPTIQTRPPKRWVAFQFSSLAKVQGTLMPMVWFWRHLGR